MKTLALLFSLVLIQVAHADEFFCQSGDVTCLIASIDKANYKGGEHTITLDAGTYTLQSVNNIGAPFSAAASSSNGLPVISSSIHIQSADDQPTIIERDINAPAFFRIFQVSSSGNLTLTGLTLQKGGGAAFSVGGPAILNQGKVSLYDSVVRDNDGEVGAINNVGTLNLFRTIVTGNVSLHEAGGISNFGGTALIEFSTISRNGADGPGGIANITNCAETPCRVGTMVVRNSSIIFNGSVGVGNGGIFNSGSLEIISSTIARNSKNGGFFTDGAGISNSGFVSITNSTIRENQPNGSGGGIANRGSGTFRLQNTIVAGNTLDNPVGSGTGPDCFGTITSLGNNLIGDPSGCDINLQSTDLTGDPRLGALVEDENEAGRTFFPVLAGSILINRGNKSACPITDQLGLPRIDNCDIGAIEFQENSLHVFSDIRPRKDANRVNPNSTKNINVVIFSSSDIGFDATTVDPNTIRFGATGTEAAPINVNPKDTDGDGFRDLVVRFKIQDTGIKCGDTSALIIGIAGGVNIISSSPLKTVQCK